MSVGASFFSYLSSFNLSLSQLMTKVGKLNLKEIISPSALHPKAAKIELLWSSQWIAVCLQYKCHNCVCSSQTNSIFSFSLEHMSLTNKPRRKDKFWIRTVMWCEPSEDRRGSRGRWPCKLTSHNNPSLQASVPTPPVTHPAVWRIHMVGRR